MSVKSQKALLTKLHNEMLVDAEDYRKLANIRFHTFVVTRRAIRRGIKDRLKKNFQDISEKDISAVLKKVDTAVRKLIRVSGKAIRVIAARDSGVRLVKFTPSRIEATFSATGQDRFTQIRKTYTDEYKNTASALNSVIKEVLGASTDIEPKKLWNLEHNHLRGIAESQTRDAIDNALLEEEEITKKQLTAWLKKSGFSLDLIRDTKTGTMEVFLGSQRANSQEGGISGAKKTKLLRILEKALRKLDKGTPLAGLPGSDSFTQIFEKELINDIIDPFRNTKGTKVSKQLKIKHSKSKNTKRINPKVSAAGSRLRRKALTTGSRRTTKTAQTFSPLQMIAQFNAMLPQTVAKNMQSPALNLQTGRLASSARVTDIAQTPKGFSSIGYTYDSNYRTFEVGNKQGSLERDPRKLIDGSIREIAVQMAMTRFYTRRV